MVLNALYITFFPFTYQGPTLWVDGFDQMWVMRMLITQSIPISILTCQYYFGSLFFLPQKWRPMTYDIYKRNLGDGINAQVANEM